MHAAAVESRSPAISTARIDMVVRRRLLRLVGGGAICTPVSFVFVQNRQRICCGLRMKSIEAGSSVRKLNRTKYRVLCVIHVFAVTFMPFVGATPVADYYALVYQELSIDNATDFPAAVTPGLEHPTVNLKIPSSAQERKPELTFKLAEGVVAGSVLQLTEEFQPIASAVCDAGSCRLPTNTRYVIIPLISSANRTGSATIQVTLTTEKTYRQINPITGWVAELGGTFGGDSIAANPDGDAYRAGGGGRLFGGYIFSLNRWYLHTGIGVRYQGGAGESTGNIAQLKLSRQLGLAKAGIGLSADSGGKVTSPTGEVTSFRSNVTPEIFYEYPAGRRLDLGVSLFINNDFSDSTNATTRKGPNVGLYVVFGNR